MKNLKYFDEFNHLNEEGEACATLGNTGGMGAIVAPQPSAIPGDVAGSTKGSGDIPAYDTGKSFRTLNQAFKKMKKKKKVKKYSKYSEKFPASKFTIA